MTKRAKKSKNERLFNNLIKVTRQFMMGRSFTNLSLQDLLLKLNVPEKNLPIFLEVLESLVNNGEAIFTNNTYRWKSETTDTVIGTIRVHPRGFGFVIPDKTTFFTEDIFIPKHLTQNAVDGDKVEVLINSESISEKGPEGRVITILERGRTHIAGIIKEIVFSGEIVAYVPVLGLAQRVVVEPGSADSLEIGDRVVLEVIDWGSKETETATRFSHKIGHIEDHRCDIPAAIEEYELRADFPLAVVEEAKKLGKSVKRSDIANREDLRHLTSVTIDPNTAKDFDDALSLSIDKKGHFHLGVHIADVTHYVKPGSALDKEAIERCNSTYFPGYCLPMLPKELSNNLCSLKPNVNRLAVSVLMELDPKGDLLNYRITKSTIRSAKRFTYEEAKLVLEKKKKSVHLPLLQLMEKLCYLLKEKRFERGSLDLSLPELLVIVDEEGLPERTEYVEYDITHQLVEEFMLKANEVIATHLTEKGLDVAYRVHETPSEENIGEFVDLARAFGFELVDSPGKEELQNFFDQAVESLYGQHLAACYIRRMRMAVYSPENIGHYGLSLTHYCHFTSPIRRYADILIHRALFDDPLEKKQLEEITHFCSEQERISAKAESSVKLLKKLRLLRAIQEEDPHYEYEAVITNVKPWGMTIEILAFMMESFIHISEVGDDYFEFIEREMRLKGKYSGASFRSGDEVKVMLGSVDFITQESKWDLISNLPKRVSKRPKTRSKKKKDKRKR